MNCLYICNKQITLLNHAMEKISIYLYFVGINIKLKYILFVNSINSLVIIDEHNFSLYL